MNVKLQLHHRLQCTTSTQTHPKNPIPPFLHTISKLLEDDLKVASQVQPSSPPQDTQMRPPSAPRFGDDTRARAGSGSHLAVPGSDLSNQTELAEHHTARLIAQRGAKGEERGRQGEEAQRVRGVQMVDNNLYTLTTLLPVCLIS